MYQLSRLLHDKHRDLHDHLEEHDIAPTLYAAPWFLTMFASQFPMGFVARVFGKYELQLTVLAITLLTFVRLLHESSSATNVRISIHVCDCVWTDVVFSQGSIDVMIKTALVVLGNHKELIKNCTTFESIVNFLKVTLPEMGIIQMERVFNQVRRLHFIISSILDLQWDCDIALLLSLAGVCTGHCQRSASLRDWVPRAAWRDDLHATPQRHERRDETGERQPQPQEAEPGAAREATNCSQSQSQS